MIINKLSLCQSVHLSVCPSICPSVHLSVRPSVRPFTSIYALGSNVKGSYMQGSYLWGLTSRSLMSRGYSQGFYVQGCHIKGSYREGSYIQWSYIQKSYSQGSYVQGSFIHLPVSLRQLFWNFLTVTSFSRLFKLNLCKTMCTLPICSIYFLISLLFICSFFALLGLRWEKTGRT